MDFFKLISEKMKEGQKISMTILKKEDKLVASLIADTNGVKDVAVKDIPPLVINGTPEEFDEGFAEVFKPIERTLNLMSDVKCYEAEVEEARKKTEMEKKEKEKTANEKKKFDEALSLAKKLKDEHKFKDAKDVLDKAIKMESADSKKVAKLLSEISKESGEGTLFGGNEDLSDGAYAEREVCAEECNEEVEEEE